MGVYFDPTKRDLMNAAWANHQVLIAGNDTTDLQKLASLFATFMLAVGLPQEREMKRSLRNIRIDKLVFNGEILEMPSVKSNREGHKVDGFFGKEWASRPENAHHLSTMEAEDIERPFDPNSYVGDLVEVIRNAIAHGHIRYSLDESRNQITTIQMANIRNSSVREEWTISVEQLESLITYCVEHASDHYRSLELLAKVFPVKD